MKPIRTIKFKRDPRFTPGLPAEDLAEIEEAAYRHCEIECDLREWETKGTSKRVNSTEAVQDFSREFCDFWNIKIPRVFTADCDDRENELGCNYYKSCYNFILVCGQRKGWWYLRSTDYRRSYAQTNGYYGW